MGQKNIQGDVNFVGAIKQNGNPLSGGTKIYLHRVRVEMNSNQSASFAIFTTNSEPLNTMDKLISEMSYENNKYLFCYVMIQNIGASTATDQLTYGLGRLWFNKGSSSYYYLRGWMESLSLYPSIGIIFKSNNDDLTLFTSTESNKVNDYTFPKLPFSITDSVTEL